MPYNSVSSVFRFYFFFCYLFSVSFFLCLLKVAPRFGFLPKSQLFLYHFCRKTPRLCRRYGNLKKKIIQCYCRRRLRLKIKKGVRFGWKCVQTAEFSTPLNEKCVFMAGIVDVKIKNWTTYIGDDDIVNPPIVIALFENFRYLFWGVIVEVTIYR